MYLTSFASRAAYRPVTVENTLSTYVSTSNRCETYRSWVSRVIADDIEPTRGFPARPKYARFVMRERYDGTLPLIAL